jgi:UBA/TS-N domain
VRRRRRESFADEIKIRKAKLAETKEIDDEELEEKLMSRANSVLEQLSGSSKNTTPMHSPQPDSRSSFEDEEERLHQERRALDSEKIVSPESSTLPTILVHSPTRTAPPPPPGFYRRDLSIATNLPILSTTSSPSLPSPSAPQTPPPAPIAMLPAASSSKVPLTVVTGPYNFRNHANQMSPPIPPKLPSLPPRPVARPSASFQHPFQAQIMSPLDADQSAGMYTSERAIFRIVEMGFTVDDAKTALRSTDRGDGLRVDRAVEWLLTRQ